MKPKSSRVLDVQGYRKVSYGILQMKKSYRLERDYSLSLSNPPSTFPSLIGLCLCDCLCLRKDLLQVFEEDNLDGCVCLRTDFPQVLEEDYLQSFKLSRERETHRHKHSLLLCLFTDLLSLTFQQDSVLPLPQLYLSVVSIDFPLSMASQGIAQVRFGSSASRAPIEALRLVPTERPRAGFGEMVVRLTARPINPSDLNTIRNNRFSRFGSEGRTVIIGDEGCGVVDEVGEGVTKFSRGQRVIPLGMLTYFKTAQGTWQNYIVVDQNNAFPVPPSVSDEAAAQFIVNPWTAMGLLERLAIPKGEYLLQTAAASSVGRILIQLARYSGVKTINVVRREEWRNDLLALGADEVINSKTEDVRSRVKEITNNKMAYAALDAIAGVSTKGVAACVRDKGMLIVYGALSSNDVTYSIYDLRRGIKLDWFYLGDYLPSREKIDHVALEVMRLFELRVITPHIGRKFPLSEFKDAIIESEREGRGGKVLLTS